MNPTQQFRRRLVRSNPNDLIYYLPMGARVENAVNRAIWIGPRSYLGSVLVSFWVFGLCFLPNESPSSMRFSVAILAQAKMPCAVCDRWVRDWENELEWFAFRPYHTRRYIRNQLKRLYGQRRVRRHFYSWFGDNLIYVGICDRCYIDYPDIILE